MYLKEKNFFYCEENIDSYNPYFEFIEISVKRGTLSFGNHDNKQTSSG